MPSLLDAARSAWLAADDFRQRRRRYKRFTYGDQWSDPVPGPHGGRLAERDFFHLAGKQPYTNNLIRQLVKTVVGRFRSVATERKLYSDRRDSLDRSEQLAELDARLLEEFLISGMAVQRVDLDRSAGKPHVRVSNIDPRMFFINRIHDPRGRDIELIGECLDLSMPEILQRFGHGDLNRIARLQRIYSPHRRLTGSYEQLGVAEDTDFLRGAPGKCRVIELWTLDSVGRLMCSDPTTDTLSYRPLDQAEDIAADNVLRTRRGLAPVEAVPDIEFCWNCRWLSPWGEVLDSCRSPYSHGSHPYVVRLYPLTDGEIHPFVEDIIDQQRLINRLIMMLDKMMATSAKGVLLFPLSQLPDGVDLEDVSRTWARSDGVIPITGQGGALPQQVVTSTDGIGAYRMLELQMKLFDNISGVSDALQGKSASTVTGAGLFDRQVENATIALSDLLESFMALMVQRRHLIDAL